MRRFLLLACLAQSAAAQTPEPVVVTGSITERRTLDAPYAISTVEQDDLRLAGPMINLSEALQRVPGVVVNNRSNFAQDLQISSRGFGARASFGVRGVRLIADGLPASGPDGQGQVSQFDLSGAQRIEVLRGPFSVLYGNSSGGVIVLTRAPVERASVRLDTDVGSFGLRQTRMSAQAAWGQGWSAQGSWSHAEVEGFRPQSGAVKTQGQLRTAWRGPQDELVFSLSLLDQPADDPLGLTRTQWLSNPQQTTSQATQFDTRKTLRQRQTGLVWRHRFDEGHLREVRAAAYAGTRAVTQWLAIAPATQTPPRHGGGVVDLDRGFEGVDLRARWAWTDIDLVVGGSIDRQRDERRGFENFIGTGASQLLGLTGRLRRDEFNAAGSRDAYAQAEWAWQPDWSLVAGLRAGRVTLSAQDRYLANGDDSGRLAFRYANPVAGLRWQATTRLVWHLSAARGFESPTLAELAYRPDGSGGFNTTLRPSQSRQWELGFKARWTDLSWDAAWFDAATQDELAVATNAGGRSAFQNAGRTRRQGLESSLVWRLSPRWSLRASGSLLTARYLDAFLTCESIPCLSPQARVEAGNRLAGTPRVWGFAEAVHRHPVWGDTALEWRAVGAVPVNDRNTDSARGHGLLGLRWSTGWRMGPDWRLESLVRVDNLLNRRHVASVIVNEANGRFLEPGAPRQFLLGLRLVSDL